MTQNDALAYRLLGWTSADEIADEEGECVALPAEIRANSDGMAHFRRAALVLSGAEGRLAFRAEDEGREGGGRPKDPLRVAQGYFRLIDGALGPASAAPSPVLEEEWLRLACELLKKLADALVEAIRKHAAVVTAEIVPRSPSSPGATEPHYARAVVQYFMFILQNIHPHLLAGRIKLLGASYRPYCDVAEAFASLLEVEKKRMDKVVSAFLPAVGWEALSGLSKYVDELSNVWNECQGLFQRTTHQLLAYMDRYIVTFKGAVLAPTDSSSPAATQSKVIVFLLARVTSLVQTMIRCPFKKDAARFSRDSAASTLHVPGCDLDDGGIRRLIIGFLKQLVKIVNVTLAAHAHRDVPKAVTEIRSKAEMYLTKMLGGFDAATEDILLLGLKCFIEFPPFDEMDVRQGSSLSKLLLMKHVLTHIIEAKPSFAGSKTMLDFFESFLGDIATSYHLFRTPPSQIQARKILSDLLRVLESASHMLFCSEIIGGKGLQQNTPQDEFLNEAMVRQHYLLIRWLSPTPAHHMLLKPAAPNHPMTREVLLHILQERIELSCTINGNYSRQDATHLISLLSQLLFHRRTETCHRRNIATLLVRLLSPESKAKQNEAQTDATLLTIQALWSDMEKSAIITSAPHRKRCRRERSRPGFVSDDVAIIGWVLETLAKSSIRPGRRVGRVSGMMPFVKGILKKSTTGQKSQEIFLLSLLVGAVRATSNLAELFLSFDSSAAPPKISPETFIDGILAYIELWSGNKRGRSNPTRQAMMHTVCIRLVGALSEWGGCELLEPHVTRMGHILKRAIVSEPSTASVQAMGLQYEAVAAACKMGGAFRPKFGPISLQVRLASSFLYLPKQMS